jgi:hypothetical protein
MRKSTKLVLAAGAATLAVAGAGSAFTAGNTVPNSQAGYGQGTVSGVTVTDIHYTQNAADASKLDTVVFDTATDIMTHAKVSTLTLEWVDNSPSTQFSCVNAGTGPYTITCDVSGGAVPIANVGKTDLTVADS